jgi:hypothetical protein
MAVKKAQSGKPASGSTEGKKPNALHKFVTCFTDLILLVTLTAPPSLQNLIELLCCWSKICAATPDDADHAGHHRFDERPYNEDSMLLRRHRKLRHSGNAQSLLNQA